MVDRGGSERHRVKHFIHARGCGATTMGTSRNRWRHGVLRFEVRFDFGPFTIGERPARSTASTRLSARAGSCSTRCSYTRQPTPVWKCASVPVDDVLIETSRDRYPSKDAGGGTVTEHAKVVIGADGRIPRWSRPSAEHYNESPRLVRRFTRTGAGRSSGSRSPSGIVAAWPRFRA